MKTNQFNELIQAVTGRPIILDTQLEEIPLDSKISIRRPYGTRGVETVHSFYWETPKKEDSILRSFITDFCSKYKEPDPETYENNTWATYAEAWHSPETHWNCSPWHHHPSHQTSKEKLKSQIIAKFSKFDSNSAKIGFYETNYGIGIFTIYGGEWVEKSISSMSNHLASLGIPYRNEISDAGWVTRFVIGLDKPAHSKILGKY